MTIREIEEATGLPRANVRYYESLGLIHPARAANGYRDYRQEDLDTLLKIKLLRQLDCSLEDIQALEQGTRSLEQVLSEVGAALEKKDAQTQHALELCRQMRPTGPAGTVSSRSATSSGIPPSPHSSLPCRTPQTPWAAAAPGGGTLPVHWTIRYASPCGSCFCLRCSGSTFCPPPRNKIF